MKKIMFSDAFCLTQAVLDGTKTMTRRLLKVPKTCNGKEVYGFNVITNVFGTQYVELVDDDEGLLGSWKPYYEVGEVVAIAQSYHNLNKSGYTAPEWLDHVCESSAGYKNKMFVRADLMPHHIKITDVKVERLQDISDNDIMREGVWQYYDNEDLFYVSKYIGYAPTVAFPSAREAFWYLIDSISGKDTWERNPWVVAYSFELVD